MPYFLKSEDNYRGRSSVHGAGGEWRVERQRLSWPILDAFRDAAQELGIPRTDDFNTGDNEGSGYFEVNQRGGLRWNATKAFLRPILSRHNLRVVTGAEVERLEFEGNRVSRVCYRSKGRACIAKSSAEIILSAGAINSPKILELSGIGDPEILSRAGIEPRHSLRGVGGNLQDHLQIRTVFRVEGAKTLNQLYHNLFARAGMGLEYLVRRSGPLSMAPSQLGIFAKSDPALTTPDLEYHVPAAQHRSAWRALAPRACRHSFCLQSASGKPRNGAMSPVETRACRRTSGRTIFRRPAIGFLPPRSHPSRPHADGGEGAHADTGRRRCCLAPNIRATMN